MKRRLLSALLALCMALALLPGTAATEDSDFVIEDGVLVDYTGPGGDVVIPDGVTSIGTFAFGACENLTNVTIPNSVTSIGEAAFEGCDNLTSITIPDSVTSIGHSAFYACRSLTSITIPNSITKIEDWAFTFCDNLISATIPGSVTSIGEWAFGWCESLASVDISKGVTSIGDTAFEHCGSLTSVTIPDSVTSIGKHAFFYCTSLTSVIIPGSVTNIGGGAFSDCDSLTSATILNGVTSIGGGAFLSCDSLTNVTIPSSVTSIGNDPFLYCANLTDVYYAGSEQDWQNIIDRNNRYSGYLSGVIHFNSAGPGTPTTPMAPTTDYIYDTPDPGEDVILHPELLDTVTDTPSAVGAVQAQVQSMTAEQKSSATGADLATLYAETAAAKASTQAVSGGDILINAELLSPLEPTATQASAAVETALSEGGVTTARYLSKTVVLTTEEASVTVRISPDALTTSVDKVRVETPSYALTFKLSDLEPDLTRELTFTAEAANPQARAANRGVSLTLPGGRTTNSITVSLPTDDGASSAQTVATTDGAAASSKYNPATTDMDGRVNQSGTYTIITNEKDFTDISNKSQEMQDAIRYLASRGIINGRTETTFDPDGSITRAEIANLLVRALGKLDAAAEATFSDVTNSNWYYAAAASSQRHGLIKGYDDNTFRGTTEINKVQIVAVSSRVLKTEMGYREPAAPATYLAKYSDSVSGWAQAEVALATRENLVVYRTDGTFSGDKNMTRGDAAIIIYRLFQRIW